MTAVLIYPAGAEAITSIRSLAEKTWKVAYSAILSPEQLAYMLDLFYSESSLAEQMRNGHLFIMAKDADEVVGFASWSPKSTKESAVYRLHKIYIDPLQQGKGTGKLLIDFIVKDVRAKKATVLELNVNRHNPALYFYQKLGFKIIREEDIDIGSGYFMNDFVMELAL